MLLTIKESLSYGITRVISSKEKGTLSTPPVILSVILMPLATPRFSAGTEPIIELVLGDMNSARPKPNKIRLNNTALVEEFRLSVENQIRAKAFGATDDNIKGGVLYEEEAVSKA